MRRRSRWPRIERRRRSAAFVRGHMRGSGQSCLMRFTRRRLVFWIRSGGRRTIESFATVRRQRSRISPRRGRRLCRSPRRRTLICIRREWAGRARQRRERQLRRRRRRVRLTISIRRAIGRLRHRQRVPLQSSRQVIRRQRPKSPPLTYCRPAPPLRCRPAMPRQRLRHNRLAGAVRRQCPPGKRRMRRVPAIKQGLLLLLVIQAGSSRDIPARSLPAASITAEHRLLMRPMVSRQHLIKEHRRDTPRQATHPKDTRRLVISSRAINHLVIKADISRQATRSRAIRSNLLASLIRQVPLMARLLRRSKTGMRQLLRRQLRRRLLRPHHNQRHSRRRNPTLPFAISRHRPRCLPPGVSKSRRRC